MKLNVKSILCNKIKHIRRKQMVLFIIIAIIIIILWVLSLSIADKIGSFFVKNIINQIKDLLK